MYDCILKILKENQNKTIAIVSHATDISYLLNKWCNIKIEDNMLSYKYNNKEILKGPINYYETLKLPFDIESNLKIQKEYNKLLNLKITLMLLLK